MMDIFSLAGGVALVTGAGSGIGQRIAVGLAEAGADVGCFDLPASVGLAETVQRIRSLGRHALPVTGSVTASADLARAVGETEARLGPLTGAVNCAGIADSAPAEDMPEAQWRRMFDVNATGVFLSAQAEARAMLPRGHGAIVNIASMSGVIVNRGLSQAHYNAAKAAVIHLTKSLAMEWSSRGIRVNAISPGYTITPMNARPGFELAAQFKADTPLGRMAEVDELVGPAVFLLSKAASFCTGVDLLVDGGFCCW